MADDVPDLLSDLSRLLALTVASVSVVDADRIVQAVAAAYDANAEAAESIRDLLCAGKPRDAAWMAPQHGYVHLIGDGLLLTEEEVPLGRYLTNKYDVNPFIGGGLWCECETDRTRYGSLYRPLEGRTLLVEDGAAVKAGDLLSNGSTDFDDLLSAAGLDAATAHAANLLSELTGLKVEDTDLIVQPLFDKLEIIGIDPDDDRPDRPGLGAILTRHRFRAEQERIIRDTNFQPPAGRPVRISVADAVALVQNHGVLPGGASTKRNRRPKPSDGITAHDVASLLPDIPTLRDRCRSLAMLDAILQPDSDLRRHKFDVNWSGTRQLASMDNGAGDKYSIVFSPAGAFICGFDHESPMSPFIRTDGRIWPGVVDSLPEVFRPLVDEPEFALDGIPLITACLWRESGDQAWHTGAIDYPSSSDHWAVDGANWLFSHLFDWSAERYKDWADYYYDVATDLAAVRHVCALQPLTADVVTSLRPGATLAQVSEAITAIGYPMADPTTA